MGVQALRLDTVGVATVIDLGPDTAHGLREHIGCRWFDCVGLTDTLDMWLVDEGAIVGDPIVNVAATAIARHYGRVWRPTAASLSSPRTIATGTRRASTPTPSMH